MFGLLRLFAKQAPTQAVPAHSVPTLDALRRLADTIESEPVTPGDVVTHARQWNRAALMASKLGEDAKAKQYFGRAIDGYIEGGLYDTAAVLCRRFLATYPGVVRAHCTLALLCVVRRDLGDAVQAIEAYAQAAQRTGTSAFAIPRLRLVAKLSVDVDVQRAAVHAISALGGREAQRDSLTELSANPAAMDAQKLDNLVAVALLNEREVRAEIIRSGEIKSISDRPQGAPSFTPVRSRFPGAIDIAAPDTRARSYKDVRDKAEPDGKPVVSQRGLEALQPGFGEE